MVGQTAQTPGDEHLAGGCQFRRVQAEKGDGDVSAPAVREPGVALHDRADVEELQTAHMQRLGNGRNAALKRDADRRWAIPSIHA